MASDTDTTTAPDLTARVRLEGDVWDAGSSWTACVEAIAARYARVNVLDAQALLDTGADLDPGARLERHVAVLDAWAAGTDIDWEREAIRFFDENAPRFLRPDRAISQDLRRRSAGGTAITLESALPTPIAESIARHLGVARSATAITGRS